MKVIVIGGVAGGSSFVTRFRRINEKAEIILIEKGKEISFASCAIPYFIGGIIKNRSDLIERTPKELKEYYNIDVRIENEVIEIEPKNKILKIKNLKTNIIYEETYDKLVISMGAKPILPKIEGLDNAKNIFYVREIKDADNILNFINTNNPKNVTIIGGGIGSIEFADNFINKNLNVSIISSSKNIIPPYDNEFSELVLKEIRSKKINVYLSKKTNKITDNGKKIILDDGTILNSDMIFLMTKNEPNSDIAKIAGIETAKDGHIIVDNKFRTNILDIYAIGDIIQTFNFITGLPKNSNLSTPANRQGHLLADIINGKDCEYEGLIGDSVAKVFDLTLTFVGLTEKLTKKLNEKDITSVTITPYDIAPFFPNASREFLKIVFDKKTGKIYGAEGLGPKGIDKEIGIISTAIRGHLKIQDLPKLEIPYSPPYNNIRDAVNVLGYVAIDYINDSIPTIKEDSINEDDLKNGFFLAIKDNEKKLQGEIKPTINIPLNQLRNIINEIPKDKKIFLTYKLGTQNYIAARILKGNDINPIIIEK